MGTIVTFHQDRGLDRTWVPKDDEDYWIRFWGRGGVPAARLADYRRWGSRFYPPTDTVSRVMLRPRARRRTNYAHWQGY